MITKTFKLTIATDTEEQMGKEKEHLSMVYGAEEITEGAWIASPLPDDWVGTLYTCSNCGSVEDSRTAYCPRCGAKMEAET